MNEQAQDDLVTWAWKLTRPAFGLPYPSDAQWRKLARGSWGNNGVHWDDTPEFVLCDTLALIGIVADASGIGLIACCGIHEDPREIEYASLSAAQARSLARALNKAAKLIESGELAERAARGSPIVTSAA